MNPKELVQSLDDAFKAEANKEKAASMSKYMRDHFKFYGIQAEDRRRISREVLAHGPQRPEHHYIVKVVKDCWRRDQREFQYFAIGYLRTHHRRLLDTFMPIGRDLLTRKSWWDTVDGLSAWVCGPYARFNNQVETFDTWIENPNMWVNRAAILHQLGAKHATDTDRLFAYCRHHAGNSEFFIQKAIGWALRDYAKTDPEAVLAFVEAQPLAPLSQREALKHLAQ